jgi:uncharacterized membrane protein YeaQ/YmgE (transglycosylase-associated protein family)
MGIIGTVIIGFLVGLVARFFKPGDDKLGFILTTFVGILGAFAGTYLGQAFGIYEPYESAGFIGAVVGAIIILSTLKALSSRK